MPCCRQHPDFHHEPGRGRRQNGVHATGYREVHFAPLQADNRLADRGQRRCAGKVHRHCRPFQAQRERYASHGNAPVSTQVALLPVAGLEEVTVLVPAADSGIDAGAAAP